MPSIVASLCILAALGASALAQPAALVVQNAKVYTADPSRPRAKALAVDAGRIVAVGDDVSSRIGPKTQVIDARGAAIVPGFIDSHGHVRGLGDSLANLNLREAKSADEVARQVAEAARGAEGWRVDFRECLGPDALARVAVPGRGRSG